MASYSSYIKKINNNIKPATDKEVNKICAEDQNNIITEKKSRVKKPLKILTTDEQKEISEIVDWHEYIDPPIIQDSEEE